MTNLGDHFNKFLRCKWQPISISNCKTKDNNPLNLIEKSFHSLSPEEKQKIQQELYHAEQPIDESADFINEKLEEFQREISKLSVGFKKAYVEAVELENLQAEGAAQVERQSIIADTQARKGEVHQHGEDEVKNKKENKEEPNNSAAYKRYVSSREYLLMFLRSERFNARLAARRIGRYFQEKKRLFGDDKLTRRIKKADLNEDDLSALKSGRFAVPGITDSSGRLIAFGSRYRDEGGEKLVNVKRAMFYLFESWLEHSKEAQRNGVVFIVWAIGPSGAYKSASNTKIKSDHVPVAKLLYQVMPMHVTATHLCYCDLKEHVIINLFLLMLSSNRRRRTVCHYDPPEVCMFNLIPYGIDVDGLPLTQDGNFKDEDLIQYAEALYKMENN